MSARRKKEEVVVTTEQELRYLADLYEQAQKLRIQVGERLRAVIQGRDPSTNGGKPPTAADKARTTRLLKKIAAGENSGPVPFLGRSYSRYWQEERDIYHDMMEAWQSHPAYEWLNGVRGVGATLGCKLLARLDVTKADNPSSFWRYCGLATVPGEEYRCSKCKLIRAWPAGYEVSGKHKAKGKTTDCKGRLQRIRGPEDGVRVAEPYAKRGQKAPYDGYAKKVMYLICKSFIMQGGAYEKFFRRKLAYYERERPGWNAGRRFLAAMRCTEKLFLSHLWNVWREATGLPIVPTWEEAHGSGATEHIDPWEMVEEEEE